MPECDVVQWVTECIESNYSIVMEKLGVFVTLYNLY